VSCMRSGGVCAPRFSATHSFSPEPMVTDVPATVVVAVTVHVAKACAWDYPAARVVSSDVDKCKDGTTLGSIDSVAKSAMFLTRQHFFRETRPPHWPKRNETGREIVTCQ
jgi:hypothetical protein